MKLKLVKITPEGCDPERMIVTEGSSAHELVEDYAKDNGYPIEEHACANRFECILKDLERIRHTIEVHCPIVMKQPTLGEGGKPYNDELSQCFTNIEIACNEEMDDPELIWMQNLPTYEEYTKDWSFEDKLRFLYDEDISLKPKTWTSRDLACAVKDPEYFVFETDSNLKQILLEREYIREGEEE